jgi:hypothetical protein
MSNIVPTEQFLLRRAATEQQRAADSMRGLVRAVDQFVEVVDQACEQAKAEMSAALARTNAAQRLAADERQRAMAVLDEGDLEAMIAERDRLLAERQRRFSAPTP